VSLIKFDPNLDRSHKQNIMKKVTFAFKKNSD